VIDCEEEEASISDALDRALSSTFRNHIRDVTSPYGDGHASSRIKETVKDMPLGERILKKGFYDMDCSKKG
jgi:UDP-N-acetylglucosamine 2-epimerase